MCLSLLSGGCGSKGFISDQAHPEILFAGKSFNSLGFAVRRNEWERHFCPVWLSDLPTYNCEGREAHGWDWSVYLHLIMTQGLFALQPAAARATHTGRYGQHCKPEFHDSAFTGLDLAEGSAAERSYRVLPIESLPASLRRQASLWEQTNSALRVMNEKMPQLKTLLHEQEELRQLTILWAFRMFLGRDPEPESTNNTWRRAALASSLQKCGQALSFGRSGPSLRLLVHQSCRWTSCQTLGKPSFGLMSYCCKGIRKTKQSSRTMRGRRQSAMFGEYSLEAPSTKRDSRTAREASEPARADDHGPNAAVQDFWRIGAATQKCMKLPEF